MPILIHDLSPPKLKGLFQKGEASLENVISLCLAKFPCVNKYLIET